MNKEFKRRITHEAIIFLGLMILLFFITRLWPLVFLAVIFLFICVIRMLFLKPPKLVAAEQPASSAEPEKPDTEQDILRRAFGLIQRRITEYLVSLHPDARWVWSKTNPMAAIADGEQVFILLNRAGGFRKAEVLISNLQFKALRFETACAEKAAGPEPIGETAETESTEVNYGLMAYEWVETQSMHLNERCNAAIANGERTFLIPSDDLPAKESWRDICDELVHSGFYGAEITDDGIQIIHSEKIAERK